MAQMLDVRCLDCDLTGSELCLGSGRDLSAGPFESRLFYCPRCEGLGSHEVLQPVDSVRELLAGIEEHGHGWAGAPKRVDLSYEQFVQALVVAHLWPRCPCGGRYKAVQITETRTDEGTHRCPRCKARSLKAVVTAYLD